MKKINLSNSELRLLILLLSLICLSGSYFLVFRKTVNKAVEIEALNEQKRTELATLEQMVGHQEEVEAETTEKNQLIEDIIAKYPSDLTTEKVISVVQKIEDNTKLHVSSISFLSDNAIGDIATLTETTNTGETEEGAVQAADSSGNAGYYTALSMNYDASYEEFKEMVTYINNMEDRVTISAISASYDNETDRLTGVMTINLYYLTNTGKEYKAPEINGIGSGKVNIFESNGASGNGSLQSEVETDDGESSEEEGSEAESDDVEGDEAESDDVESSETE